MKKEPEDDFDIYEGIEDEDDIQIVTFNEGDFEDGIGFDPSARNCSCCEGLTERCNCVNKMNLPMCYCAID